MPARYCVRGWILARIYRPAQAAWNYSLSMFYIRTREGTFEEVINFYCGYLSMAVLCMDFEYFVIHWGYVFEKR